jgi:hypothetical protein
MENDIHFKWADIVLTDDANGKQTVAIANGSKAI